MAKNRILTLHQGGLLVSYDCSNLNNKFQIETGNIYDEAIDIESKNFSYEETNYIKQNNFTSKFADYSLDKYINSSVKRNKLWLHFLELQYLTIRNSYENLPPFRPSTAPLIEQI